jgi:cysteine desulfurase
MIYLDNSATTRVDPRVLEAMLPYFDVHYGNAASRSHAFGWQAEEAVENARRQIAALLGAKPAEIVLTSGATESNNLAITGVARANRERGNHIITCATEHKSVLDTCRSLEDEGFEITVLPVDAEGRVSPAALESAITEQTILVSLMAANNETGVVHDLAAVAEICRRHDVLLHTDATQAAGKLPLDVSKLPVDLVSISAHKMYGPKGVGALYVRRRRPRIAVEAIIHGGGHQDGMRSGTLAVPMIVAFGAACEIARVELEREGRRLSLLRDRLEDGLRRRFPTIRINGHSTERLPGVTNISFEGVDGESLLTGLTLVAASAGSACTSHTAKPSYVLGAMGVADDLARASLRLSVGRFNTVEEIDFAIDHIAAAVEAARIDSTTAQWEGEAPAEPELSHFAA